MVIASAAIWPAPRARYNSIVARLVRGNVFARVSYDLTDKISLYGTAIFSEVVTWDKPTQSFFKSDNLQIGCDNPFLPTIGRPGLSGQ